MKTNFDAANVAQRQKDEKSVVTEVLVTVKMDDLEWPFHCATTKCTCKVLNLYCVFSFYVLRYF